MNELYYAVVTIFDSLWTIYYCNNKRNDFNRS